jgi:hypothetical protein
MSDLLDLALPILGFLLVVIVLIALGVGFIWLILAIFSLPWLPGTIRVRWRLKQLKATGFAPSQEWLRPCHASLIGGDRVNLVCCFNLPAALHFLRAILSHRVPARRRSWFLVRGDRL